MSGWWAQKTRRMAGFSVFVVAGQDLHYSDGFSTAPFEIVKSVATSQARIHQVMTPIFSAADNPGRVARQMPRIAFSELSFVLLILDPLQGNNAPIVSPIQTAFLFEYR